MNRIKNFFTNNIGFKFIAIVAAFIIWILVVNIDDPKQSRNFTTNVEVVNAQLLSQQGKYYTIPDGDNTVTFRVTARRTIIEQLTTADFEAIADMEYLENDSRVPIEISVLRFNGQVSISNRRHYLEVNVGDEMTQSFVVEGVIKGTPADGCVVDEIGVSPDVIEITGPVEIVSAIDHVEAECNVEGASGNLSENAVPVIVGKGDKELDISRLRLSEKSLRVTVSITNIKTVPIQVETSGRLPNGVDLSSISTSPSSLQLKGDKSILNDITEIIIPPSVIDLSNISSDFTTTVDITTYLPSGVSLSDSSQAQVTIKVTINQLSSQNISIPVSNIVLRNLGQGLSASFDSDMITVNISGTQTALSALNADNIKGHVDLSGLAEGVHTVRIDIDSGDGYSGSSANAKITISR